MGAVADSLWRKMKRINKQTPPPELAAWIAGQPCDESGKKLNCGYDCMPGNVHDVVKASLLREQGCLCCYTGLRISDALAHIEHLFPQTSCTDGEDVAYDNLCTAFPEPNRPEACPFGAQKKGGWYDPTTFISPLSNDCEAAYLYDLKGGISHHPRYPNAEVMIEKLGLKHDRLSELRAAKINEWIFPDEEDLTVTQVNRLLARLAQRDEEGRWMEFCFVLQQACREYIRRKGAQ